MTKPKKAQSAPRSRAKPTNGEQAAVKLVLGDAPPAPPQAPYTEQSDLLEDLLGLPKPSAGEKQETEHRGRGRAPGSRNKRTIEWTEYLLSRYASPLEVLAQIATMPVKDLVASLRCTKLEALQEKRFAAIALLPYLHAKQPVAIDITKRQVVNLNIIIGDDSPPPDEPEEQTLSLTATVVERLTNDHNAQPQLEIPGAAGVPVHGVDQAGADHQRADRRR